MLLVLAFGSTCCRLSCTVKVKLALVLTLALGVNLSRPLFTLNAGMIEPTVTAPPALVSVPLAGRLVIVTEKRLLGSFRCCSAAERHSDR